MPILTVAAGAMPNPVTIPPDVDTFRPAIEDGYIEGTARNPEPATDDSPQNYAVEVMADNRGRPTLAPLNHDTRPRRYPGPLMSAARAVARAWSGDGPGTHAEFDPEPATPPQHRTPPASAGYRNTFRAPPQPWDTTIIVTPQLPQSYRD